MSVILPVPLSAGQDALPATGVKTRTYKHPFNTCNPIQIADLSLKQTQAGGYSFYRTRATLAPNIQPLTFGLTPLMELYP